MPSKKKEDGEKIQIKNFKDGSSNYWVNNHHYNLNENGEIIYCAGGIDTEELREALKAYIKRNKKVFKPREVVAENRVYEALIPVGRHKGKLSYETFLEDPKWTLWLYENYTFKAGEEKLKEELKELLRK